MRFFHEAFLDFYLNSSRMANSPKTRLQEVLSNGGQRPGPPEGRRTWSKYESLILTKLGTCPNPVKPRPILGTGQRERAICREGVENQSNCYYLARLAGFEPAAYGLEVRKKAFSHLVWVMDGKSGKSRAVYMPDQVKDLFKGMTPGEPEALIFPGPGEKSFRKFHAYLTEPLKSWVSMKALPTAEKSFPFLEAHGRELFNSIGG
jgi:hypothetical protein